MDSIKNKLRKKFKGKGKNIIIILLIFSLIYTVFVPNTGFVYGKTNQSYGKTITSSTINVDKASKDNTVLEIIAWFVYIIANFVEWIGSIIVGWFAGKRIFPWADKVIFNTIPFLDINFINPQPGSLFLDTAASPSLTIFGKIIQRVYYTIYTLSISALGITVGVMAIKIAISSIASEKAKYKKAIQNWLLALILIFTIHYLISFIFFINEKIVEVASSILLSVSPEIEASKSDSYKENILIILNKKVSFNIETKQFERSENDVTEEEKYEYENSDKYNYYIIDLSTSSFELDIDVLDDIIERANHHIRTATIDDFDSFDVSLEARELNPRDRITLTYIEDYLKKTVSSYNAVYGKTLNTFFNDMSSYFKDNIKDEGDFQPIIAILYAVFVIESFMYFISYIRRFFYVVTLAMFAPIVIIFEFLQKTVSG